MKFLTSRTIFLLDACGALLSASLLMLFSGHDETFGIPFSAFAGLASIAAVFSLYSLTCHLFAGERWRTLLKIIAVANLLYCGVTLVSVIVFRETITAFGIIYFLLEIAVIVTLATFELKLVRKI